MHPARPFPAEGSQARLRPPGLGAALLGCHEGDEVTYETPTGVSPDVLVLKVE